jgi:hypothetical protein
MKVSKNNFFIFVFGLVLLLPLMGQFSGISDRILKSSEKRKLAQFPIWEKTHTKQYVSKVDAWYKDNFGFRNVMFRGYSALKYYGLHTSPLPERLILGKEGWLYTRYNRGLQKAKGKQGYEEKDLPIIKKLLEEKRQWLQAHHIQFYVAIAPNKFTLCNHNLPDYLQASASHSPTEQLESYLQAESDVPFVYLKNGFSSKEDGCDYFIKGDIHWDELGAFHGASYLLNRIKEDYPQIAIPSLEEYKVKTVNKRMGDQSQMINLPIQEGMTHHILKHKGEVPFFKDKRRHPVPTDFTMNPKLYENRYISNRESKNGLKVMIFHDSFGIPFPAFLAKSFDEVVGFRIDHHRQWWDEELILQEAPDILIFERLETVF